MGDDRLRKLAGVLRDAAVGRLCGSRAARRRAALLDRHDERVAGFGEAQFEPLLARSRAQLLSALGDPEGAALSLRTANEHVARNGATLWLHE